MLFFGISNSVPTVIQRKKTRDRRRGMGGRKWEMGNGRREAGGRILEMVYSEKENWRRDAGEWMREKGDGRQVKGKGRRKKIDKRR